MYLIDLSYEVNHSLLLQTLFQAFYIINIIDCYSLIDYLFKHYE